jgi:hypothetical protein
MERGNRLTRGAEWELADCLDRIEQGDTTVEEVLIDHPELATELEPLLGLAVDLRSLPKVAAPARLRGERRPTFANRPALLPLEIESRRRWSSLRPTIRWAAPITRLAAGIAAAFVLLGGGVIASAGSLPQEPLYPVKLAVEGAQLALAPSLEARSELQLRFAELRLAEAESAVEQGRPESLERGIALYEERVEGALQSVQPDLGGGDQSAATPLQQSLERQQEQLSRIYARAPEPAQPAILHAMEVSKQGKPPKNDERRPASVTPTRPAAAAATSAPTVAPTSTATAIPTRVVPSPTATRPTVSGRGGDNEDRMAQSRSQERDTEVGQPSDDKKNERTSVAGAPAPTQPAGDDRADDRGGDSQARDGQQVDSNGRGRKPEMTALPSPTPVADATPASTATAIPQARFNGGATATPTATPTARVRGMQSFPVATPTAVPSQGRDRGGDQDTNGSGGNGDSKPGKSDKDDKVDDHKR